RFTVAESQLTIKPNDFDSQPLRDLEFVVIDVEAIAGKSRPTRIIELGACRVTGGRIVDQFETLVNPDLPLPPFISTLTGITEEMLATAPPFSDIAEQWLDFAGDAVLAA